MNGALDIAALRAIFLSPNGKAASAFCLGALALAASLLLVVQGDIAASTTAAARLLTAETQTLRAEAKALAEAAKADDKTSLTSVPAFIDRIGALADRHGAQVGAVQPEHGDAGLFRIALTAPYSALLGFIAALEGLDVEVKSFDLKRKALGPGRPTLSASISIRARNDARNLSIPRLEAVRAALTSDAARDPFQALVAGAGAGHRLDLSEAYRLTGIAVIQPAGLRIATIDMLDYMAGDVLDGRTIVAVEADRVLLDAIDGAENEKYVIRFRRAEPEDASTSAAVSLPAPKELPPRLPLQRNR